MSGIDININRAKFQTEYLKSSSDKIGEQIDKYHNVMNGIRMAWSNNNADLFINKMKIIENQMKALETNMKRAPATLCHIISNVETAENKNIRQMGDNQL